MQQDLRRRVVLMAIIAMACLVAPSWAARRGADSVAEPAVARVQMADHLVSFEPLVPYERLSLTVIGNNQVVLESWFDPGSPVLFDLFDQEGQPLADGTYSYELRVVPKISPQARQLLESARVAGTEATTSSRLRALRALPDGPVSLNGSFTILNGAVVDPDLPESSGEAGTDYRLGAVAPQDIVHNDDVIITFSLCVGTDCVNGESFGFDTIRLKENNLRIRAFDTSNSASFPTRDWQLTFNDSTNGGANKFSIEDLDVGRVPFTIIAGAPTNSLFVASSGNVGFGTGSPVVELHVVDGDSPTLRLAQDGSSGFTAQTWDVVGNEASFFVRDSTNGSTLPFRIRPGAPNSSIDISATGNIGVGTSSPTDKIHILTTATPTNGTLFVQNNSGTAADRNMIRITNNGPPTLFFNNTNTTGTGSNWTYSINNSKEFQISAVGSGNTEFRLQNDGDAFFSGTVTANGVLLTSSRTFKEAFTSIDPKQILARVASLPIEMWNFKGDGTRHIGPFAEDFYSSFSVGSDKRHINLIDAAGVSMAAIQGLNQIVVELQGALASKVEQIQELERRNQSMESRLAQIEALLAQLAAKGQQ